MRIGNTKFLFGLVDPVPVIPGFEVIPSAAEFLHARSGAVKYLVEDLGDNWRLSPKIDHARQSNCYDFRNPITLAKIK